MTLTVEQPPATSGVAGQPDRVLLRGISWDTYERLLHDIDAAGQRRYLTYDKGDLEIMAPSNLHEHEKKLLSRMVEMYVFEKDMNVRSGGSTTWRRQDLAVGLEPDECYHIQNEPAVSGRADLNANNAPPPDLVIEVDITHHAVDREEIYAALGVPEIWCVKSGKLQFLGLTNKRYAPMTSSRALPALSPEIVERFLKMAPPASERDVLRAWHAWIHAQG